jgi:diguanylate cyclase (GGDEF)-like protein/PAS domain S-box-containing protein
MFSFFPKDDQHQTVRIKRLLIACGSYFMWCSISVLTFLLGLTKITSGVLVVCFSGIIVYNISLYAIIRTGFNKRFKDPSLTLFQMLIATFWAMVFLYYADSARSVVLLLYLVVFVFGLFRLNVREFLFLSVFAVANYAAIILLLYNFHPESINKKTDGLNIIILIMVLPWFSLIGGYITKLKAKISNAFSTIEKMTDNIQDVIFVLDMNLNYTYVSPSVKILRGYEPEEILKQTPFDAITPSSLDLARSTLSEVMELEKIEHKEDIFRTLQLEIRRKDGTTVWTETKFSFIRDEKKRPAGILGVMRDITERKRMEEKLQLEEQRFRAFVEHSSDMIVLVNLEGVIMYVNSAIENILGFKPEERIGAKGFEIVHPDDMKALADVFNTLSRDTNSPVILGELRLRHKDGSWRNLEAVGSNQVHNNLVEYIIINYRDITERKKVEETLKESEQKYRELSIIDDLTQIYNSRHFYAQLEKEIERSNRYGQPLTLLLLDLDNFKTFNDTYGHVEGDHVLSRLGKVVKKCLRETDSAYRYGGEEFTIILPMTMSDEGVVTAERIQKELRKEAFSPVLDQEVHMTVSIGVAQYKPKEEIRLFVHRVDQLMYQAKRNGRDRICSGS